jgi:RNA 2',3'-cyclic 3'-phosphodiesterase
VSSTATVGRDDRVRLFLALRLPDDALDRLDEWQPGALSEGRLLARQQLHVTLAFLGGRPATELASITGELRSAAAGATRPRLRVRGYRETRSVGMLVFDDDSGHATALAEDVHVRLERLGVYRRERRPWLPHVTVLRFRERPRLRPELPDLGEVSPSEAAVYSSVLRPTGAQYEILESVPLGG